MDRHIYPNGERFYREAEELGPWKVYPVVEELKPLARAEGLWNLFLPESRHGAPASPSSNTPRSAKSWAARILRPKIARLELKKYSNA
ncbi:alkylation response protein AidB-like acyl-CoA dehydrogenase [Bradyrhizobium sp. USDA 4486]